MGKNYPLLIEIPAANLFRGIRLLNGFRPLGISPVVTTAPATFSKNDAKIRRNRFCSDGNIDRFFG